jgi:hypothetical protein
MSKTAAVRLEGTLSTDSDAIMLNPGKVRPGAGPRLEELRRLGYRIIIVSPIAATSFGSRIVVNWLRANAIDVYEEIWESNGIPNVDLWIDDEAQKL